MNSDELSRLWCNHGSTVCSWPQKFLPSCVAEIASGTEEAVYGLPFFFEELTQEPERLLEDLESGTSQWLAQESCKG